ncbi:unnamed protein product, partial [Dovyalis caffra]
ATQERVGPRRIDLKQPHYMYHRQNSVFHFPLKTKGKNVAHKAVRLFNHVMFSNLDPTRTGHKPIQGLKKKIERSREEEKGSMQKMI